MPGGGCDLRGRGDDLNGVRGTGQRDDDTGNDNGGDELEREISFHEG